MKTTSVPGSLLLLAVASTSLAQLVGPEFRANTYTSNAQFESDVAMDRSGDFVVVWSSYNEDGTKRGIFARRFASSGSPLTDGFQVDAQVPDNQSFPTATALPDGGFVVLWTSADGSGLGVFGQRFAASGAPSGVQFRVNTITTGSDADPAVAATGDGFAATFQCADEDFLGVCLQRFATAGSPKGGPLRVNTQTAGAEYGASLGSNASGSFVVVWQQSVPGGVDLLGQRFSSAGAPAGTEFRVASVTTNGTRYVGVAVDGAGTFAVVWEGPDENGSGVFARRFTAVADPAGPVFRVNTVTTGAQEKPVAGAGPSGSFLVVWRGADSGSFRNFAQLVGSSGEPLAGELRVSTNTLNSVFITALTRLGADGNGNFVIAWNTHFPGHFDHEILARRLAMPPEPVGAELRVNAITPSFQQYPQVGTDGAGNFVVVWENNADAAANNDVSAQRFTGGGVAIGGEFRINTLTLGEQEQPAVAAAGSGFVVCWKDGGPVAPRVFGQRFTNAGAPMGAAFRVNVDADASQLSPRVASTGAGFLVAWVGLDLVSGSYGEVVGRRFTGSGTPLGQAFRVNTQTVGPQSFPVPAATSQGGFVIAWNGPSADAYDILVQRFASSGAPVGGEVRVNQLTTGRQFQASIAVDAQGGFVVAWTNDVGDGSGSGIAVRRFSSSGAALGPEFVANTFTTGQQTYPAVAVEPGGDFMVSWSSYGQDGSGYGVFQRHFRKTGEPRSGEEFLVNTYTTSAQIASAVALSATTAIVWNDAGDVRGRFFRRLCRSSDEDGNGAINVSDVLYLINHLFAGGPLPSCGGDVNGDGSVNVSDVLYLINHLFAGGPSPV